MLSNAGINTHSNRTKRVELKEDGKDYSFVRKIEKISEDREKHKSSTQNKGDSAESAKIAGKSAESAKTAVSPRVSVDDSKNLRAIEKK